jgi:hypothetical protein
MGPAKPGFFQHTGLWPQGATWALDTVLGWSSQAPPYVLRLQGHSMPKDTADPEPEELCLLFRTRFPKARFILCPLMLQDRLCLLPRTELQSACTQPGAPEDIALCRPSEPGTQRNNTVFRVLHLGRRQPTIAPHFFQSKGAAFYQNPKSM